jgi:multidrug resistance efflux pump
LKNSISSHKLVALLIGLVLVMGLLSIPRPYRIPCEAQVEPIKRRFVAAPFDGVLERALVKPGDVVREGQVLAVMDGREIRWELAGLAAEMGQAAKERDGHLARHDFGAAQLAGLEVERLRVREELLSKRGQNLEIKSPIDGVVVVGDLEKSEGVPLAVGERLFEIAPLEQMLAEVAIPEADLPWTQTGQAVEIVWDAYPDSTWQGTLERIHPRSELRDEEYLFIGEVLLENPEGVLRPGMHGRVAIQGPKKPWGWNLFHKPWHELRYFLGW